jgi:hypothetical protein
LGYTGLNSFYDSSPTSSSSYLRLAQSDRVYPTLQLSLAGIRQDLTSPYAPSCFTFLAHCLKIDGTSTPTYLFCHARPPTLYAQLCAIVTSGSEQIAHEPPPSVPPPPHLLIRIRSNHRHLPVLHRRTFLESGHLRFSYRDALKLCISAIFAIETQAATMETFVDLFLGAGCFLRFALAQAVHPPVDAVLDVLVSALDHLLATKDETFQITAIWYERHRK